MTNVPSTQTQQLTAKSLFSQQNVKQKFEELLGKKAQGFITSVLQIVASNHLLAKADPMSIFNAAATAATLDLPINQNLGFAYIIPYNSKDGCKAQFQLGFKGFIQLAQRSGQFHRISAAPIFSGQLIAENPLTGFEFDFKVKASGDPIGYAAYFKLLNGFEATYYMTIDEVKAHGMKHSKSFKSGPWQTDFNAMATKTVIKLLLSKFAPLSIEMQKAIISDQAVINDSDTQNVTYIDAGEIEIDKEQERIELMLADCKTIEAVKELQAQCPDVDWKLFEERKEQIENESK